MNPTHGRGGLCRLRRGNEAGRKTGLKAAEVLLILVIEERSIK